MRNKPNLFVVGAQKAGTTRLCYLLSQHPDVFFSSPKEPAFFKHKNPSPEQIAFYESLFFEASGAKIIGEGSTAYSRADFYPGAPERVHKFAPSARIIYMVRHPLARLESGWIQARSISRDTPANFCQAIRTYPDLIDTTLYWKQLSIYLALFPNENILVIFFEDFIRDEEECMKRCCEFLGIAPNTSIAFDAKGFNVSEGKLQARPFLDWLRSLPLYEYSRRLMPQGLRRSVKGSLMKPMSGKPQWDRDTLAWAIEQLQSDTQQFLRYTGKPDDFWVLSLDRAAEK